MVKNADKIGGPSTAGDDPRLTRIGKILRKYKIDELPQLLNILKGEMAVVGPRPEVPEVVALMTEMERQCIFSVKPGLVDLATLWDFHEEDNLVGQADPHRFYLEHIWPTKKKLQMEYVENRSVWLDLKIIVLTMLKLLNTLVSKSLK